MAIVAGDKINVRDLRAKSSGEALAAEPTAVERSKPLVKREIAIRVQYPNPDTGEVQDIAVISRIPDLDIKAKMARCEAHLRGGLAFSQFTPDQLRWQRMVACITFQLVEPPEWLVEAAAENVDLLFLLHDRCAAHELLFFRPGAASSGATQSVTRVAVTSDLDQWLQADGAAPSVGE